MDTFIENTSILENVNLGTQVKILKNCKIQDTLIGEKTVIDENCRIASCKISERVDIDKNSNIYSSLIGRYSYVGKNFTASHSEIGAFCSVSWNVSIGGAEHDYNRVSTHAFLFSPKFGLVDSPKYDRFNKSCIIGNDVWIAANVCVCRGVKIGDGAVIAAGAVVTKDVEPYTIVAGVPAAPIKKRFDDDVIDYLIKSKWWNLPHEIIKENIGLFNSNPDIEIAKRICELSSNNCLV